MNCMKKHLPVIIIILFTLSCKESTEDLFEKAARLANQKKYEDAVTVYDKLIKRNNKMQAAFYGRGFCHFQLKDYKNSLLDYNMVIWLKTGGGAVIITFNESPFAGEETQTQVDYYDALYQRGQVYYYMDSLKRSLDDFQKLADYDYSEKSNCFLWLGRISLKTNNIGDACRQFQQARSTAYTREDINQADAYLKANCSQAD
jgi:hypothetical protein